MIFLESYECTRWLNWSHCLSYQLESTEKGFSIELGTDFMNILDDGVFPFTHVVWFNLIPSRWWSAWPWKSFQIRKRRRGKWISFDDWWSNVQKYSQLSSRFWHFKLEDLHDQFQAAGGRVERRLCWSESSSCENLQASVQGASCSTNQLIISITQWS